MSASCLQDKAQTPRSGFSEPPGGEHLLLVHFPFRNQQPQDLLWETSSPQGKAYGAIVHQDKGLSPSGTFSKDVLSYRKGLEGPCGGLVP